VPDPFEPAYGRFKVGLHHAGPEVDAETRTFEPDPDRVTRVQTWVDEHIAGAVSLSRSDTCLYTFAPDEDFIMDRVGPLVVASPCSGHGFKFVPLFGQVIADLATNTRKPLGLEAFALDRAGLRASSRTR
jgi:sarcosine oxidase